MMRSRYFIPIVFLSFPLLGLVIGSLLGDQLSIPNAQPPYWDLASVADGYEAGGVLGLRASILCAILVVGRRIYNDRKATHFQ
jgi:small basic protein